MAAIEARQRRRETVLSYVRDHPWCDSSEVAHVHGLDGRTSRDILSILYIERRLERRQDAASIAIRWQYAVNGGVATRRVPE